ncbi:MAG: hypothetical protein ACP5IL_07925 [Syntrophobacteraceae bacterium]
MTLSTWWKVWSEPVVRLVALAGSLASLVGILIAFLLSPKNLPFWAIFLIILALVCFVLFMVLEFSTHRCRHIYPKTKTEEIKKYMHDWIKHGGRVAIWTRDMSWAQSTDMRNLLKEKATRNELILCLPAKNKLATELATCGAEVCDYGASLLESPNSRFTIVFFGKNGARVAVGRLDGDTHIIDEFDSGSHPAFYLAADLVALVRAKCAQKNSKC